jgi:hypothetical protein
MRKLVLTAAMVLAAWSVSVAASSRADAMAIGSPAGLGVAADSVDVTENVQYLYGGRRYCWYVDGWQGPGWYWCGYRLRRGYGWGGPVGWQGWSYGRPVVVGPRRGVVVGPRGGVHYHH